MIKQTKKKVVILIVLIFLLIGLSSAFVYQKYEPKLTVAHDIVLEYGDKIGREDFKKLYVKNLGSNTQLAKVDVKTDEIGTFKGHVIGKTKFRETKISFPYKVEDTQIPEISGVKDIELELGEKPDFSHISAKDPVDGALDIVIEGEDSLDIDTEGTYDLIAVAVDKNNNKTSKDFKVVVKEKEIEVELPDEKPIENEDTKPNTNEQSSNKPAQNTAPVISNPSSELVLVNRKQRLPYDYVPKLKEMPSDYVVKNYTGYYATPNTVDAFMKMVDALYEETGLWLWNTSSYRGADFQEELYTNYVNQHGQAEADRMSAKPGHSEHQTGLVIDVVTPDGSMWTFGQTEQSAWVNKNAHRFGFIVRYPEGKEHITGYMPEAWHLRYIGVDAATSVYQSGLTFDEWLD